MAKPCNTTGFSGLARPTERFVARGDGGAGSPTLRGLRQDRRKLLAGTDYCEFYFVIGGKRTYLWRAVDDEGEVLGLVVRRRRGTEAALRLLKRLLHNQPVEPETITTDGLLSYGAALDQLDLRHLHRPGRLRENNRAENSRLRFDEENGGCRGHISSHGPESPHHPGGDLHHIRRSTPSRQRRSPCLPGPCGASTPAGQGGFRHCEVKLTAPAGHKRS